MLIFYFEEIICHDILPRLTRLHVCNLPKALCAPCSCPPAAGDAERTVNGSRRRMGTLAMVWGAGVMDVLNPNQSLEFGCIFVLY